MECQLQHVLQEVFAQRREESAAALLVDDRVVKLHNTWLGAQGVAARTLAEATKAAEVSAHAENKTRNAKKQ